MQDYEALVRQAQDGEPEAREEAFAKLIDEFQSSAQAWAYNALGDSYNDVHLAQDVAQEAFLTAYQKIDQLRDPAAFPGWLKRIVLTHAHRQTRRKSPSLLPLEDEAGEHNNDPALHAETRELEEQLNEAVRALPEHEREVTELFYITGYSQQEIAKQLALPLTTVKKRLQYAREHLRETMPPITMLHGGAVHGSAFGGALFFDLFDDDFEFDMELGFASETLFPQELNDDLLHALAMLRPDLVAIA
jgi:RNA polymerase sigma-70 factor (ECF subfamily)